MNFRRTRAMARKEFLHIIRDSRSLIAAIVQPLMMLLLFSYALSLDVDRIPVVVYDLDHTPASNDLVQDFRGSRYFTIVEYAQSYKPIERAMDERRALVGIAISPEYSRNLSEGKAGEVQILLDGADSNTAQIALGYAQGLVQMHALRAREATQSRRAGSVLGALVDTRVRVWYNTDLVSRNYIVPGLIAVIIMIIAAMLTSLTVAREWEMGTMEQLLSTPVRPAEIAMGKLAAYFALGVLDMAIALFVALVVFHVPFRGSPWLLLFSCAVYLFGALAWGIWVSAGSRTQLAAYQLGTFTSFLPAFLLSGFIYSIANMPLVVRVISLFVPARYFINIIKGVFLKGIGLEVLWFDVTLLVLYGAVVFYFTTRKLRQKVA